MTGQIITLDYYLVTFFFLFAQANRIFSMHNVKQFRVCVSLSLSNPGALKAACSLLGGMAQTNSYGQSSNGVADESPNMLVYRKVGPLRSLSLYIAPLTVNMTSPGNQLSALAGFGPG